MHETRKHEQHLNTNQIDELEMTSTSEEEQQSDADEPEAEDIAEPITDMLLSMPFTLSSSYSSSFCCTQTNQKAWKFEGTILLDLLWFIYNHHVYVAATASSLQKGQNAAFWLSGTRGKYG